MWRFSQVGIALGALGVIICFMGLFPGVTGASTAAGIGLVQVLMVVVGYGFLALGALIYLKCIFFLGVPTTLSQQIGLRLAITGILFAAMVGLADIVGFGSHIRDDASDIFFGQLQMVGILASFALSSVGVLVYVLAGAKLAQRAPFEALSDSIAGVDETSELQLVDLDESD